MATLVMVWVSSEKQIGHRPNCLIRSSCDGDSTGGDKSAGCILQVEEVVSCGKTGHIEFVAVWRFHHRLAFDRHDGCSKFHRMFKLQVDVQYGGGGIREEVKAFHIRLGVLDAYETCERQSVNDQFGIQVGTWIIQGWSCRQEAGLKNDECRIRSIYGIEVVKIDLESLVGHR